MLRGEGYERQVAERRAVGERELAARDIRIELRAHAQGANTFGELLLHRFLHVGRHRALEEHLAIDAPGHELDMQLEDRDQLAHPRPLERIARIERLLRGRVLEPLADHLRFAELRAVDLEERDLAHRRAREEIFLLRRAAGRIELERHALLQHRDAHLVEVVADVEATELEHGWHYREHVEGHTIDERRWHHHRARRRYFVRRLSRARRAALGAAAALEASR